MSPEPVRPLAGVEGGLNPICLVRLSGCLRAWTVNSTGCRSR